MDEAVTNLKAAVELRKDITSQAGYGNANPATGVHSGQRTVRKTFSPILGQKTRYLSRNDEHDEEEEEGGSGLDSGSGLAVFNKQTVVSIRHKAQSPTALAKASGEQQLQQKSTA